VRAAQIRDLKSEPVAVDVDGTGALEIVAVALNPLDLAIASGVFYGGHPPLPYVPGCEAVGRRDDGTLVYLFGDGRGIAKDGFLIERTDFDGGLELPAGTDPGTAAALGIAGIAAWVPVAWKAQVTPDDRVLVLGGTGTVGRIAAQAARLLGAKQVVAVGRDGLDRIGEDFDDGGFTVCIDPVWGEPLANALAHAARHARIVHIGQSAGPESPLRSADVRGKELHIMGHSNFALSAEERDGAYLELLEHVTAGRIELDVQTFSLEDVAAAWKNQRGGKSVIVL